MNKIEVLLRSLGREFPGFRYSRHGAGYQCGYRKGYRWNSNQKPMTAIRKQLEASSDVQVHASSAWWMRLRAPRVTFVAYRVTV